MEKNPCYAHQEAEPVAIGGLGSDETQGSTKKHQTLDPNVQNSRALVDELAESGNGENR
jgi:hypothetical protein